MWLFMENRQNINRPEAQGTFNSSSCDLGVKSTISFYLAMQVVPTA